MSALGSTFQILAAVVVVILLFAIGFAIYNMETIKAVQDAGKLKKRTDIFLGVKDLPVSGEEAYTTTNSTSVNYKDLALSVNQMAGAEYTYNFWLYLDTDKEEAIGSAMSDTEANSVQTDSGLTTNDIILFMRGSKMPQTYKNLCGKNKVDIMVKGPLVKLERNADVLTVEMNTVQGPDISHESSRNTCGDVSTNWRTMNAHKVALSGIRSKTNLTKKWFMATIIVQDTYPTDPLPIRNKIRIRIYINGALELERYADGQLINQRATDHPTVMLQNMGDLYIYPEVKFTPLGATQERQTKRPTGAEASKAIMMADLSYFNYALGIEEVSNLFAKGFKKEYAPVAAPQGDALVDLMSNVSLPTSEKQLAMF